MSPNLLFVDDEPQILSGLKRSLRSQRKTWNMSFALGGLEAMKLVEEKYFDAVISDMRMPQMDGATLLRKIKETSPSTRRIVLSGYSKHEKEIQDNGYSHRYLKKPCSTTELMNTLTELLSHSS